MLQKDKIYYFTRVIFPFLPNLQPLEETGNITRGEIDVVFSLYIIWHFYMTHANYLSIYIYKYNISVAFSDHGHGHLWK